MVKTFEMRLTPGQDLLDRLKPYYQVFLVGNGQRGIVLDEVLGHEHWDRLGYLGDARKNRVAIEVRARNGRVVAATGWREIADGHISTLGTYVSKKLRRRGIATELWRLMISLTEAKQIDAHPVTDYGMTLVKAMQEKLPDVKIKLLNDFPTKDEYNDLVDLRKEKS